LSSRFGQQRSSRARGPARRRSTRAPESSWQRGATSLLQPRRSPPPLPSPARPRWNWRKCTPHGIHRAVARERRGRTTLLRLSTTLGRTGRPHRLATLSVGSHRGFCAKIHHTDRAKPTHCTCPNSLLEELGNFLRPLPRTTRAPHPSYYPWFSNGILIASVCVYIYRMRYWCFLYHYKTLAGRMTRSYS
jgi:hypothetical protein